MEKVASFKTKNGREVFLTTRTYLNDEIKLDLIASTVANVNVNPETLTLVRTIDFGRPIGLTRCVKTKNSDEIFYAVREGKPWPTRYVKNRLPEPSSKVTVIIAKGKGSNELFLKAIYIGDNTPPETWDVSAINLRYGKHKFKEGKQISIDFWSRHALIQ